MTKYKICGAVEGKRKWLAVEGEWKEYNANLSGRGDYAVTKGHGRQLPHIIVLNITSYLPVLRANSVAFSLNNIIHLYC